MFTLTSMTFAALISRLRLAIAAAWIAPFGLFLLFIEIAATPERFVIAARLGPATLATVVGIALAAAFGLPRIVQRRCAGTDPAQIRRGLVAFGYASLTVTIGYVGIVTAVAFYETGMHLHMRTGEVAVLATLSLLYAVVLAVPLYLVCADLLGRHFAASLGRTPLLPLWLTNLVVGGGITLVGCTTFVLAQIVLFDAVSVESTLVAGNLALFGIAASYLAHRGLAHATQSGVDVATGAEAEQQ